jgi:hypothetical protein
VRKLPDLLELIADHSVHAEETHNAEFPAWRDGRSARVEAPSEESRSSDLVNVATDQHVGSPQNSCEYESFPNTSLQLQPPSEHLRLDW